MTLIPNASDLDLFRPDVDPAPGRERLGLGDRFAAIYFGGMGVANGLDYVVSALQNARRLGWVMLGCVCMYGLIVMSFSASRVYPLSISLAFLGGMASTVFLITSMTVLQLRVPDGLRGRVMGIHGIAFSLISLGGLFGGTVASATSLPVAAAIGASVVLLATVFVAVTRVEIRRLDGGALESAMDRDRREVSAA